MNLRNHIENWQVRWAERSGIPTGAPPGSPTSRATGYVRTINDNLFEPLSDRVKQQFIAGAGGELEAPDGQSGNMYAVYSSSALCVNLFHFWSRLLDVAPQDSMPAIERLLAAFGLPAMSVQSIDFEVPLIVNPHFKVAPHIDVQISFDSRRCQCAGIEAKFCEPYGGQKPGGGLIPSISARQHCGRIGPMFAHLQKSLARAISLTPISTRRNSSSTFWD